jgi:hypothetical protein
MSRNGRRAASKYVSRKAALSPLLTAKVFIHVPKPSVIVYVGEEEAGMHVPDLVESSLAVSSTLLLELTTRFYPPPKQIAVRPAYLSTSVY